MNYKLEKFWNLIIMGDNDDYLLWTINLKSFEIVILSNGQLYDVVWTINLKSFEILTCLKL